MAQWIRHRPTEPGIVGSSPTGVITSLTRCRRPVQVLIWENHRLFSHSLSKWFGSLLQHCVVAWLCLLLSVLCLTWIEIIEIENNTGHKIPLSPKQLRNHPGETQIVASLWRLLVSNAATSQNSHTNTNPNSSQKCNLDLDRELYARSD